MEITFWLQPRRLAKAPRRLPRSQVRVHFFIFSLVAEACVGSAQAPRSKNFVKSLVAQACAGFAEAPRRPGTFNLYVFHWLRRLAAALAEALRRAPPTWDLKYHQGY